VAGRVDRELRDRPVTLERLRAVCSHLRQHVQVAIEVDARGDRVRDGGVAIAAGLERRLRQAVPSVRAVAVPESGAGRLSAVVALVEHAPGEARTAALAALEAVNLVKLVTVVDADVDPWDDAAVAHAVATRVHFDRDLHVLPDMRADRAEPLERDGTIAKLAIDATRHAGDRADWTPAEPP
jgi:2,5-furandicarboxylate decarboxylase 1